MNSDYIYNFCFLLLLAKKKMNYFLQYIKDFHKSYYNKSLYIVFGIYVTLLIVCNYIFGFEPFVLRQIRPAWLQIGGFIAENLILYAIGLLLVIKFSRHKVVLSKQFIIYSFFAIVLIGFDRSFSVFINGLRLYVPHEIFTTSFYIISNATSIITMLIPLIIFKRIFDSQAEYGLYGLRIQGVNFKMYYSLLFLVIPLVFFASFIPEFIRFYPIYKKLHADIAAQYWNIPEISIFGVFETIYIGDFIFTELAFRGLLIIGISKFLGKNSILPMVAIYASLHFGKPIGETISSVFGGYILGILALYSKNIWGGVFLHCGVALSMEIFGIMQMNLQ